VGGPPHVCDDLEAGTTGLSPIRLVVMALLPLEGLACARPIALPFLLSLVDF